MEFILNNLPEIVIFTPIVLAILFLGYIVIQREFFDKDR
jgi:hypothetical protein